MFLYVALLLALCPQVAIARDNSLQLSEFNDILSTEAANEFTLHGTDHWNSAIEYGWNRAKRIETIGQKRRLQGANDLHVSNHVGGLSPFVVCDAGMNKIGYNCRSDIEAHFGSAMMALSNSQDMTCYFASSTSYIAENAPSPLVVSPLLPEMKLQDGIVDAIEKADPLPLRLYSLYCPGQSSSKDEAKMIGLNIVESVHESNGERYLVRDEFLRYEGEEPKRHIRKADGGRRSLWSRALEGGIGSQDCIDFMSRIDISASFNGKSVFFDAPEDITPSCLHSLVAALSVAPEVCSVGIVPSFQATNLEAQWITQSGAEEERPWFDVGLTGKGQIVAVSDSGLDVDGCYFMNDSDDIRKDGSVDLSQRKVVQYVAYADSSDDRLGHGTHVVGTVLGHRSDDGRSETNGSADGVAKDARVAFFDIGKSGTPYLDTPRDVADILDPGRRAGANVHSASWGSEYNGYGIEEYSFDDYLFEHDDFLVVIAAGNSGPGRGSVGSPATSKNVISVGASQNSGDHITSSMEGPAYLARFSARGPTRDGRTKPEVVAPGYYIKSAGAQPTRRGECDSTEGVHFLKGTSMAAPVVSGSAALIRQYFEEGYFPSGSKNPSDVMQPSASLMKAVLLNGAQNLLGAESGSWWWSGTENVAPYDDNQNFGRINLQASLPLQGRNKLGAQMIDSKNIAYGDIDEYVISIDRSNGCDAFELSATLVWADPPAPPNCRQCLLNDLDLYITRVSDGTTAYANGRDSRDTINNSERVRVAAADGEQFVIKVEARNLGTASQKYALAVVGCLGGDGGGAVPSPIPGPLPSPDVPAPLPPTSIPKPEPTIPDTPDEPADPVDPSTTSIVTTTEGTINYFGNMFNIDALNDVLIQSFGIHTSSKSQVSVKIWTKGGSLVGSHKSSAGWALIASTTVQGRGQGNITPIPMEAFSTAVSIGAGRTQAFYVTLDTEEILLSDGRDFGLQFVSNNDLVIDEGTAHTFPFGQYFYPYVWNGAINYVKDESQSIATTFEADTNYLGCVFDVEAKGRDIVITGMDIHTLATETEEIEIWTRAGSFKGFADSLNGWTPMSRGIVQGLGKESRTRIPSDVFNAVTIPKGSTVAFYVTFTSADVMLYKRAADVISNNDLSISTGAALNYPFNDVYPDRTWNGVLRYEVQ